MNRRAFTLIEMLTVIAIAAIMMTLGVVAYTRLSKGTKLQTAASNLVNTMEMARQYAITQRVTTFVIFPLDPTKPTTNFAPPYVSYAVVVSSGNSDEGSYNTNSSYLTQWKRLPEGIVFDFTKWAYDNAWNAADPYATGNNYDRRGIRTGIFNISDGSTSVNQRTGFLHFGPTYYQPYNVFLREGYFDPAAGLPVYTPAGVVTNVNFVEAVVAWPNGRIFTRKK